MRPEQGGSALVADPMRWAVPTRGLGQMPAPEQVLARQRPPNHQNAVPRPLLPRQGVAASSAAAFHASPALERRSVRIARSCGPPDYPPDP
eukprot:4530629-Pleurochrysis_carterae.AAC.1